MYSELTRKRFTVGGQLPSPEYRPDPERYDAENKAAIAELDGLGEYIAVLSKSPLVGFFSTLPSLDSIVQLQLTNTKTHDYCVVEYNQQLQRISRLIAFNTPTGNEEDETSHLQISLEPRRFRKPIVHVAFNNFGRDFSVFHTNAESQKIRVLEINHQYTSLSLHSLTTTAGLPKMDVHCISHQQTGRKATGPIGRVSTLLFDFDRYHPGEIDLAQYQAKARVLYDYDTPTITMPDGLSTVSYRDARGTLFMTSRVIETPMFEVDRDPHQAEQQYRFSPLNLDYLGLIQHARLRIDSLLGAQAYPQSSQ